MRPDVERILLVLANDRQRPYGIAAGMFTVPDDFDDPLPEDILRLFEGSEGT